MINLKVKNFLKSNSGFTLIESILAGTITLGSMLAIGTAIKYTNERNRNTRYVTTMIDLEFQLISAFVNPTNYSSDDKSKLSNGEIPINIKLKTYDDFAPELSLGEQYFTDGKEGVEPRKLCSGFSDPNCIYKVDLSIQRVAPHFLYAYRITLNPQYGESLTLGALRQPTNESPLFSSSDYKIRIPTDIYPNSTAAQLSCAEQGKSAAAGIINNELFCINKPLATDACPEKTFAKHIEVYTSGTATTYEKYFKLGCEPSVSYCCPNDYSFRSFHFPSSDGSLAGSANNICVFSAQRFTPPASSPQTKGPAYSIIGEVCPPKYKSISTCRLTTPGPPGCTKTLDSDVNINRHARCEVLGDTVTCAAARVTLNVRCELDVLNYPEIVPPTKEFGGSCPAPTPNVYTSDPAPPSQIIYAASIAENGLCGSANGIPRSSFPSTSIERCTDGTFSSVDSLGSDGTYNWRCLGLNGGSNMNCSANRIITSVAGECGASSGVSTSIHPTTNLCKKGTFFNSPDTPTQFLWTCNGSGGGPNASCFANKIGGGGGLPVCGGVPRPPSGPTCDLYHCCGASWFCTTVDCP